MITVIITTSNPLERTFRAQNPYGRFTNYEVRASVSHPDEWNDGGQEQILNGIMQFFDIDRLEHVDIVFSPRVPEPVAV